MLTIKNGPNTIFTLNLLIFLEVHVWREKNGWNGLYKLLVINGKIYIINIPHRLTNF